MAELCNDAIDALRRLLGQIGAERSASKKREAGALRCLMALRARWFLVSAVFGLCVRARSRTCGILLDVQELHLKNKR